MNFQEVERRYSQLKQQYDASEIGLEDFDAQLERLMVQDDDGRWWAKSRETGEWYYHDGNTWIKDLPPGYQGSDVHVDFATDLRIVSDRTSTLMHFRATTEAENWSWKGSELAKSGRYQEALEAYDNALSLSPDDPEVWTGKGAVLDDLGYYEEALEAYDRALSLSPDDPQAWHLKGVSLDNLGRARDALEAFDRALSLKPDFPEPWNSKGVLCAKAGHYEEAIEFFDRALSLRPDYPPALQNRDRVLTSLSHNQEEVSMSDPHSAEAWKNKGGELFKLGRHDEALEAYDRALSLRSDTPDIWYSKAGVLNNLGRHQEALECYNRALSIEPGNPHLSPYIWFYKGVTLFNLDTSDPHQEAREWLCRAWRAREQFPDADLAANLLRVLGHDPEGCETEQQERSPMPQVQKFDRSMIRRFLDQNEFYYLLDTNGDFHVTYKDDGELGCDITFLLLLADEHYLLVRGIVDRLLDRADWGRTLLACNQWMAEQAQPKVYLYADDYDNATHGQILLEQWLNLEQGIHQELLNVLIDESMGFGLEFCKWAHQERGLW